MQSFLHHYSHFYWKTSQHGCDMILQGSIPKTDVFLSLKKTMCQHSAATLQFWIDFDWLCGSGVIHALLTKLLLGFNERHTLKHLWHALTPCVSYFYFWQCILMFYNDLSQLKQIGLNVANWWKMSFVKLESHLIRFTQQCQQTSSAVGLVVRINTEENKWWQFFRGLATSYILETNNRS